MSAPLVTVICIFLNEERFLAEAFDSVLTQDYRDFELLLVDDGSTDGSSQIARAFATREPDRVTYLEHPCHENRGQSASRNLGLAHASGKYVAIIDGDDRWLPVKIAEQVSLLEAHPNVGMVCGGYNVWRSWDGGEDSQYFPGRRFDCPTCPPDTLLELYPLGRANNPTDPMFRREVLRQVGGWEDAFPGLYEDIVLNSKVFLETEVVFARRIWHNHRIHSASCTASAAPGDDMRWRTRYLDWLAAYLDAHPELDDPRIRRSIARARREMRFARTFRLYYRMRHLAASAARKAGLIEKPGNPTPA